MAPVVPPAAEWSATRPAPGYPTPGTCEPLSIISRDGLAGWLVGWLDTLSIATIRAGQADRMAELRRSQPGNTNHHPLGGDLNCTMADKSLYKNLVILKILRDANKINNFNQLYKYI